MDGETIDVTTSGSDECGSCTSVQTLPAGAVIDLATYPCGTIFTN